MESEVTNSWVLVNTPDVIVINTTDKICLLIDVAAIPSDRNVIKNGG